MSMMNKLQHMISESKKELKNNINNKILGELMKISYTIAIINIIFGFLIFNIERVSASDTITYSNSLIYNIDNEHDSINIKSSDIGMETETTTIHNVPIKIRGSLQKTFNDNKKRYNITVSNSNNFVSMSKAPEYENYFDKANNFIFIKSSETQKNYETDQSGNWLFWFWLISFMFCMVLYFIKLLWYNIKHIDDKE